MNDQSRNLAWNQRHPFWRQLLSIAKEPQDGRPQTVDGEPQDVVCVTSTLQGRTTDLVALYAGHRLMSTGFCVGDSEGSEQTRNVPQNQQNRFLTSLSRIQVEMRKEGNVRPKALAVAPAPAFLPGCPRSWAHLNVLPFPPFSIRALSVPPPALASRCGRASVPLGPLTRAAVCFVQYLP
jgi:hypothetical protein